MQWHWHKASRYDAAGAMTLVSREVDHFTVNGHRITQLFPSPEQLGRLI
jgi:acyl-coenzyme A synthetase/AMP-(fatty) acid ligase